MTSAGESGLGLFDDTASAVGNFPSALRGYDRTAVDDYVRSLEAAVVQTRRRAAGLEQQIATLQSELADLTEKHQATEVDYASLGGRASDILRLAEEQAREVLAQANTDAERVKELARRDADLARQEADRTGTDIRATGAAELERLRTQSQTEIADLIAKATAEAEAVVAAARRQAESLQRSADHEAQTLRQNAYLDTEALRRAADSEVADIRRGIAEERELALGHLRSVQEEAAARTAQLLAEATEHSRLAGERLEHDIAEGARIRAEALAESERVRLAAVAEAEERLTAARKQAAAITDRTQQEFGWRKQQLRREMDLLGQRKQAVLNQLASLSALAAQTADSFPDLDDLDAFDAEQGDRTITMPAQSVPAMPPRRVQLDEEKRPAYGDGQDVEKATEASTATRVLQAVAGASAEAQPDADKAPADQPDQDEDTMEIDGDATILVPASQLPAGTAHLRDSADAQPR